MTVTPTINRQKFTPPQVARRWGIGVEKGIAWIRSGELKAINTATRSNGRPRYLIDEDDLAVFEARRIGMPQSDPIDTCS